MRQKVVITITGKSNSQQVQVTAWSDPPVKDEVPNAAASMAAKMLSALHGKKLVDAEGQ